MDARTVRLRMGLAYDGAPFRGWARQPGLPSVQAAVEDALELVFRHPCTTVVAGRTDTGVHARRQTVHVDVGEQAWQRLAGTHARSTRPSASSTVRCGGCSAGTAPSWGGSRWWGRWS